MIYFFVFTVKKLKTIVLASSSVYRSQLLSRLRLPFLCESPDIDETPLYGESPEATALRLAMDKARKVAINHPGALVIGSDQVAVLEHEKIGKPHTFDNALRQLQKMRGKTVVFHTALCLYNSESGNMQSKVVPYDVQFRDYTDDEIVRYLDIEKPFDCAGSAKSEGFGIVLIAAMRGDDPNALVGLPLIALIDMLKAEGVNII